MPRATVLSHGLLYAVALGISGLTAVLAVAVFTRLLGPTSYGLVALALSAAGWTQAFVFDGMRFGVIRFLSGVASPNEAAPVAGTLLALYGAATVLLCAVTAIIAVVAPSGMAIVWLSGGMAISDGWSNLALSWVRARMRPAAFLAVIVVRGSISLISGVALVYAGYGVVGALAGYVSGSLCAVVVGLATSGASAAWISRPTAGALRSVTTYGLPLVLASSLQFTSPLIERSLVAFFAGISAAGQYAIAYDLVQKVLVFVFLSIHAAAFPAVVRRMDREGPTAAREQLHDNLAVLLRLTFPVLITLLVIGPSLAAIAVGPAFRDPVGRLLPPLAIAAALNCFFLYYVAHVFHLAKQTKLLAVITAGGVVATAASATAALTWSGLAAMAYAAVVSQVALLAIGTLAARRVLHLSFPTPTALRVLAASVGMAAVLLPFRSMERSTGIAAGVLSGSATYCLVLALVDASTRRRLAAFLNRCYSGRAHIRPAAPAEAPLNSLGARLP
jgi:O-antigen/teichoic acid export membrane protein